jgi:glycosyltransferase involved in cell wall biosynthesis
LSEAVPAVSVIIPAYRASMTLREAIESCLAQDQASLEVLVVEDGSGDATLEVARSCEASDRNRVRVLQHEGGRNLGVAASRNLGIERARGRYIAFLDSDDAWLPHKLRAQLEVLETQPEIGLVFGDVDMAVDPDPTIAMSLQDREPAPFRAGMAQRFNAGRWAALEALGTHPDGFRFVPSPTPLVRAELLADGPRFVGKPTLSLQYEDYLMWLMLAARTGFHCLPESLAVYRVHRDSFTGEFAKRGSSALHLVVLEQVQDYFLVDSGARIPAGIAEGMRELHGRRLVEFAYGLRWRDMGRMLGMARGYGVARRVLKRRVQASVFNIRAALGQAKRKLVQGAQE